MIRSADERDLDTLVAMRMEFLAAIRGPDVSLSPDFVRSTRSFIERELHVGRAHSWLAEEDDVVVGIVTLLLWPRPPLPEDDRTFDGYVLNMFVVPGAQGRGVGRRLLDECIGAAAGLGVRSISLQPTDAGRPLYESMEFVPQAGRMVLKLERPAPPAAGRARS